MQKRNSTRCTPGTMHPQTIPTRVHPHARALLCSLLIFATTQLSLARNSADSVLLCVNRYLHHGPTTITPSLASTQHPYIQPHFTPTSSLPYFSGSVSSYGCQISCSKTTQYVSRDTAGNRTFRESLVSETPNVGRKTSVTFARDEIRILVRGIKVVFVSVLDV